MSTKPIVNEGKQIEFHWQLDPLGKLNRVEIADNKGDVLAVVGTIRSAQFLIARLNALSGISDPERAISEAREALEAAINWHYATINDSDEPANEHEKAHAHKLEAALAMMLGSAQLAMVMGQDEEMTTPLMEPVTVTICETCSTRDVCVAEIVEYAARKEGE